MINAAIIVNAFINDGKGENWNQNEVADFDQWSKGMGTGFERLGLLRGLIFRTIFGWKDNTDNWTGGEAGILGHEDGYYSGYGGSYEGGSSSSDDEGKAGLRGGVRDFGHLSYQPGFHQKNQNYEA